MADAYVIKSLSRNTKGTTNQKGEPPREGEMGMMCDWCDTPYDEDNPHHMSCLASAMRKLNRITELEQEVADLQEQDRHSRLMFEQMEQEVGRLTGVLEIIAYGSEDLHYPFRAAPREVLMEIAASCLGNCSRKDSCAGG